MENSNVEMLPDIELKASEASPSLMNKLEERVYIMLKAIFGGSAIVIPQDERFFGRPDFTVWRSADGINVMGKQPITIVFVDGDLWHDRFAKMQRVGLKHLARGDDPKAAFWLAKAAENRRRDREVNRELKALGYIVCRLKESKINGPSGFTYISRSLAMSLSPKMSRK